VPLYEYKCLKCGRNTEKIENVSGPHLKKCPHCGGKVESVITAPSIQFKGSGWYVTDYAGKSKEGEASKSDNTGGDKKESDAKEASSKDGSSKEASGKDGASKESSASDSSSKEKSSKDRSKEDKKPAKKR
jgi:putative FmdB family regulatory protein